MPPLIYVAGPLFTPAERRYLEDLAHEIEAVGFRTYLPHRDAGVAPPGRQHTRPLFDGDVRALEECVAIVAVLNGTDVDSGTAFEMGFAFARGLPIVGFSEDVRISAVSELNVMIQHSCRIVPGPKEAVAELRRALTTS